MKEFRKRFATALVVSLVLHIALLGWAVYCLIGVSRVISPKPISLTFVPVFNPVEPAPLPEPVPQEPAPVPQEVVETQGADRAPTAPTDRIAEQNSRAADKEVSSQDMGAPHVDTVSAFDQIASPPAPVQKQEAAPADSALVKKKGEREEAQKDKKEGKKSTKREKKSAQPQTTDQELVSDMPKEHVSQEPPANASGMGVDIPLPSSQQGDGKPVEEAGEGNSSDVKKEGTVAESPRSGLGAGKTRGRVEGGVKNLGFLGFDAIKDEIAPYLKIIRKRVELKWGAMLQMRYSGTSPTEAVLDCSIAPDGHVVSVEIVDAGSSVTYAPLCRDAVLSAGPFPPFPFKVPDMYRSKNLDIRWTFSFLTE